MSLQVEQSESRDAAVSPPKPEPRGRREAAEPLYRVILRANERDKEVLVAKLARAGHGGGVAHRVWAQMTGQMSGRLELPPPAEPGTFVTNATQPREAPAGRLYFSWRRLPADAGRIDVEIRNLTAEGC